MDGITDNRYEFEPTSRDGEGPRSKRKLMWRMAFMTFFLSAILDNLTTSIVMIMVLRKLVQSRGDRLIYAALVVISASERSLALLAGFC